MMHLVSRLFVVKKEGKRPHRGSCRRNTESKDVLVRARDYIFVLRCILTSRRCVGKGLLCMPRLKFASPFSSDMNGFPRS